MKYNILLSFLFLTSFIYGQTPKSSSVIIYRYDEVSQQYEIQRKYNYQYDDEDASRLISYEKYNFNRAISDWQISNVRVQDYNNKNHLVHTGWESYKEGEIKSQVYQKYNIQYDDAGDIALVNVIKTDALHGTTNTEELTKRQQERVTNYGPLYNTYDPSYLMNEGMDLIYNEDHQVVEGIISSCRLLHYRYTYDEQGFATVLHISRMNEEGVMKERDKVHLFYDRINKATENPKVTLSVFPNPTKGEISLSSNLSMKEQQEINITDVYGRIVYKARFEPFQVDMRIDLSDLAQGLYLINIGKNQEAIRISKVN